VSAASRRSSKPKGTRHVPSGVRRMGREVGRSAGLSTIPLWDYGARAMRGVCQRVSRAQVRVDGRTVGQIGPGLCVLLGVARGDWIEEAVRLAGKVARLRVFPDEAGRFDRSVLDAGGSALVVSQFTLIADSKRQKGTRPDFSATAPRAQAEPLYEHFCQALRDLGVPVETGVFGAHMQLELVNDGPVTIVLDV